MCENINWLPLMAAQINPRDRILTDSQADGVGD